LINYSNKNIEKLIAFYGINKMNDTGSIIKKIIDEDEINQK